jgi:catalase
VAIFVAEGSDAAAVKSTRDFLAGQGAVVRVVGPRIGPLGRGLEADASLENEPGVLFDALVLAGGDAGVATLRKDGRALEHLRDVFRHCKPILALDAGKTLLEAAGIPGTGAPGVVIGDASDATLAKFAEAMARHRHFERELDPPPV